MKRFFLSALTILLFFFITAHEFWLQPRKFLFKTGERVNIRFLVGENFNGENWKGTRQNIQDLHLYFDNVEDELEEYFADSTAGDSLDLQFFDEGTAMITFQSTNRFIELDAEKFEAYLEHDGLLNAISYRKEHHETDSAGREYYQRSVKTIFQVGALKNETFRTETGLPIDIIPLSHPYSLKKNDELTLKILFNKKPLTDAVVKVWHKLNGKTEKKELTTDQNGKVSFPVSVRGQWMVSTVKMIRIPEAGQTGLNEEFKAKDTIPSKDTLRIADTSNAKNHIPVRDSANWQSYWGSLTWGYTK